MRFFPGPYDPNVFAAACQATTSYDSKHPRGDGSYDACNFFNAYVLSENNVPQGQYCSFYTWPWGKSYSTNVDQWRDGDYYCQPVLWLYSYGLGSGTCGFLVFGLIN